MGVLKPIGSVINWEVLAILLAYDQLSPVVDAVMLSYDAEHDQIRASWRHENLQLFELDYDSILATAPTPVAKSMGAILYNLRLGYRHEELRKTLKKAEEERFLDVLDSVYAIIHGRICALCEHLKRELVEHNVDTIKYRLKDYE